MAVSVSIFPRFKDRRVRGFWIGSLLAALLILGFAISTYLCWLQWGSVYNEPFDGVFGAVVGALIGSIVTLALVLIGIRQVMGIAGTASADFVLRKTDQFFSDETRLLLHLIDSD